MRGVYSSPEQVIPLASILAAVAGLVLIFWGKLVGGIRRLKGLSRRSPE